MIRIITALLGGALLVLGLTGCTSGAADSVDVSADAVIVDVRTPAEYAEGHLDGAVLLDVSSGQLADTIPTLDPNAEYYVYCRSGNRSAQAAQLLADAGFTDVTDLGSVNAASTATGIDIVR